MTEILHAEVDPLTQVVQRVLVITPEALATGTWGDPANWKRTYNDGRAGHNYAGKGYTYNPVTGNFRSPQPFPSWVLDRAERWQAPVPMPLDGKRYAWDEATLSWKVRAL